MGLDSWKDSHVMQRFQQYLCIYTDLLFWKVFVNDAFSSEFALFQFHQSFKTEKEKHHNVVKRQQALVLDTPTLVLELPDLPDNFWVWVCLMQKLQQIVF